MAEKKEPDGSTIGIYQEFENQLSESEDRAIAHFIKMTKKKGHCRLDDLSERIVQNIFDFKQIVEDVASYNFCSNAEAFKKVYPYYQKVVISFIIKEDSWRALPREKKKRIKLKIASLLREFGS